MGKSNYLEEPGPRTSCRGNPGIFRCRGFDHWSPVAFECSFSCRRCYRDTVRLKVADRFNTLCRATHTTVTDRKVYLWNPPPAPPPPRHQNQKLKGWNHCGSKIIKWPTWIDVWIVTNTTDNAVIFLAALVTLGQPTRLSRSKISSLQWASWLYDANIFNITCF